MKRQHEANQNDKNDQNDQNEPKAKRQCVIITNSKNQDKSPKKKPRVVPKELQLLADQSDDTIVSLLLTDVFEIIMIDYSGFDDALKLFVLLCGKQILWTKLLCHYEQKIQSSIKSDFQVSDVFFKHLKHTNSLISGGYILDQLIGRPNNASFETDIDIFMATKGVRCSKYGYDDLSTYLWKEKAEMKNKLVSVETSYPNLFDKGITRIKTYPQRMQHIHLRVPVKRFICKSFDFEFCTSMFDGEKLEVPFPLSIMNRIGMHRDCKDGCGNGRVDQTNGHGLDVIARCVKYQQRGFTIPNYTNMKTIRVPCYKSRSLYDTRTIFKWDRRIVGQRYLSGLKDAGYDIVFFYPWFSDEFVKEHFSNALT